MCVRLVIVRSNECGAPGAESTIDKKFYAANSETLVDAIVDETRYLRAPIVIRGGITHQVDLDLSQSVHSLYTINTTGLTGIRPSSAILRDMSGGQRRSRKRHAAGRILCPSETRPHHGYWLIRHATHHASSFRTTREFQPESAPACRLGPLHCRRTRLIRGWATCNPLEGNRTDRWASRPYHV